MDKFKIPAQDDFDSNIDNLYNNEESLEAIRFCKDKFDLKIANIMEKEGKHTLLRTNTYDSEYNFDIRAEPKLQESHIDDIEAEVIWYNEEFEKQKNGTSLTELEHASTASPKVIDKSSS